MSRRPHVVIATRVFAPEPVAAAFREEALARALVRVGARVTVLTTTVPQAGTAASPAAPPADGRERFAVRRLPAKRDSQGQVRGYVSYMSFDVPLAARLLLTRGVDAVVSEPPPTTGVVVMIASALRRVPYAFYAADIWSDATDSVQVVPGPVRRAVRWMETTVWRRAARVLTISPGVQARAVELIGDRPSLTMVGNGIDTDAFSPDGPVADEAGPFFVYAGTVSEWQGAEVFCEAFAAVRARHPEARLLFFSEGTGRDALRAMVRERGIEGIEFRPKVGPREVAAHLRGAVAGLSSITPGQGYAFALPTKIYAATACGTPVIHAGTGAAHDRIAGAGLGWAVEHDPAAVAAAMEQALAGEGAPAPEHLRTWTLANASLDGCADIAARAVLSAVRGG
ncbi:glycosyltransferase family 4 protein [Brachybacterium huguangmaarense]